MPQVAGSPQPPSRADDFTPDDFTPDDFTPDTPTLSFMERATEFGKSLLPSWRTAARTVGGAVGALAGPEMIPLGVVGGELAYQALSLEKRTVPEVGQQLSSVALEGVLGMGTNFLAQWHGEHPLLPALRCTMFRSPQTLITRG